MVIKFKKLRPDAVIPKHAKTGDAGADLTALTITYHPTYLEYGTGLAVEIPDGYVGLLFPRSSISNTGMSLPNSVGVIDSGYRGEIKARFRSTGKDYALGDRIIQLVIVPFVPIEAKEVEELTQTDRDGGGFGSTGV